jgi:hypothetical protein
MSLVPSVKPGKPINCNSCGYQHPQDPPFSVKCPECHASPGTYCKRPSGHSGPFVAFHAERDVKALMEGFYDHPEMTESCGPHSKSERAKLIYARFPRVLAG